MDVKSLAKSKRAHSQHHSKKHHSKPTTVKTATPENKPSGKGVEGKSQQSKSITATLASNRDRYEEDSDLDSNEQSKSSINPATDVFVPKSKGADYKYLLSEAEMQSEANISSQSFPSFDDVLSDINEGFGSLLSARGKSILSWGGDDNFIVEDKGFATYEASFLSLNLHLLTEQLEKVELSKRLFVEPDLFLSELKSDDLRTVDEEPDQEMIKNYRELSDNQPNKGDVQDRETEANKLLYSFSSTEFLNSSSPKKYDTLSGQQQETAFKIEPTSVFNKASAPHSRRDPNSLKSESSDTVAINFDDDLDDLLKETSHRNISNDLDLETSSDIRIFRGISSGHSPVQASKPDQDLFKPPSVMPNLDDELDDLLKETSGEENKLLSHRMDTTQLNITSSSSFGPVSVSKLSNDFDSLFDSF